MSWGLPEGVTVEEWCTQHGLELVDASFLDQSVTVRRHSGPLITLETHELAGFIRGFELAQGT